MSLNKPTFRDHDLRAALSRLMQQHGDAAVINAALALREAVTNVSVSIIVAQVPR